MLGLLHPQAGQQLGGRKTEQALKAVPDRVIVGHPANLLHELRGSADAFVDHMPKLEHIAIRFLREQLLVIGASDPSFHTDEQQLQPGHFRESVEGQRMSMFIEELDKKPAEGGRLLFRQFPDPPGWIWVSQMR